MLRTFCRCRCLPFHFASLVPARLVRSRWGLPKRFACALVGFPFLCRIGLVVTSFVRIAGVLLVFSYLIVPAVCGINLATRISRRLLIGWVIAWLGGIAGLFLSFWWDLPSGAAIVCTFGAILILISFIGLARHRGAR